MLIFKIRLTFLVLIFFSRVLSAQIILENYLAGLPATDALGRKLPTHEEAGPVKKEKFVGLFYWAWHINFVANPPYNTSEILAKRPEAIYNYYDAIWLQPKQDSYFFWGEPLFGYYRNTDEWVLRKHAEMLADAGVDVIFFDCTNGQLTWKQPYMALYKFFAAARKGGVKTPQIAFMLAFGGTEGSNIVMHELYHDLYQSGLYQELWFYWKGKPLIRAYPETLVEVPGDGAKTKLNQEIKSFFTFPPGQPLFNKGPQRPGHWGWLEIYPQHGFVKNGADGFEQSTVGVAQNWSKEKELTAMNAPGAFGRNYTHQKGSIKEPEAVNFGDNFQEKWERAFEINPEFIFITGWNEWVAGRHELWGGIKNAFPDQFSQEFSRDIEPMKGDHGDNYYYQMISNIRRFKGMPPEPVASASQNIQINSRFEDWKLVRLEYMAHKGNTLHSDSPGWQGTHYINKTGRNDIIEAKVAHDQENIYFFVQKAKPITFSTDLAWMRLFIDTDRDKTTGWQGYDYVLNRGNPGRKAILKKSREGWNWEKIGEMEYPVKGDKMELKILKRVFNISAPINLEFKWLNNMQLEGDIMDFYLNGDVAPAGRFNYVFKTL